MFLFRCKSQRKNKSNAKIDLPSGSHIEMKITQNCQPQARSGYKVITTDHFLVINKKTSLMLLIKPTWDLSWPRAKDWLREVRSRHLATALAPKSVGARFTHTLQRRANSAERR